MKLFNVALVSLSCLMASAAALAAPICPALTNADSAYYAGDTSVSSNCNTIITIGKGNTFTITNPNTNPYDGNDDDYVGVINNSGAAIGSFTLTGSGIYGFDGDGIDGFGITGNAVDVAAYGFGAYGGTDAFFTDIMGDTGTVNFIGGIANGGSGYFSLENAPSAGSITGGGVTPPAVPEPSSFILLGTGALSLAGVMKRRLKK